MHLGSLHHISYYDECPHWICGNAEKMTREGKEFRDRKKAWLSSQTISYQRNVEGRSGRGGDREQESHSVSYTHQIIALCNRIEATKDMSVLDRFRVMVAIVPRSLEPATRTTLAEKVLAGSIRKESDDDIKMRYFMSKKDEQAIINMAIALQTVGALPQVNTDLAAICMLAGTKEIERWLPTRGDSARAVIRMLNDATAYVWFRSYYILFCSSLSPFIKWSEDKDPVTQEHYMIGVEPLNPQTLVKSFLPSLYVQYPEAIFAMYNYFNELYNPMYYDVLLIILYEVCGFTREWFRYSYAEAKIELPNVILRAKQRQQTGVTCEAEACDFLREHENFIERVRDTAIQTFPAEKHPNFVEAWKCDPAMNRARHVASMSGHGSAGGGGGGVGQKPAAGSSSDGSAAGQKPDKMTYNPSIAAITGTWESITRRCLTAVRKYYEHMDEHVMSTILNTLKSMTITVPWYKDADDSKLKPTKITFSGMEKGDGAQKPSGTPVYKSIPLLEYRAHSLAGGGSGEMWIATHAGMVDWKHVLFLFLTAHENPNTRSVDTLLPMLVREHPNLMHRWSVRPNQSRVLNVEAKSSVPRSVVYALAPLNEPELTQRYAVQTRNSMSGVKVVADASGHDKEDVEFKAFVAHLRSVHYDPAFKISAQSESWDDSHQYATYDERFKQMARTHWCAPGIDDVHIRNQYCNEAFFKNRICTIQYPYDVLVESRQMALRREAERWFADQPVEFKLSLEEYTNKPDNNNPQPGLWQAIAKSLADQPEACKEYLAQLKAWFARGQEDDPEAPATALKRKDFLIDWKIHDQLFKREQEQKQRKERLHNYCSAFQVDAPPPPPPPPSLTTTTTGAEAAAATTTTSTRRNIPSPLEYHDNRQQQKRQQAAASTAPESTRPPVSIVTGHSGNDDDDLQHATADGGGMDFDAMDSEHARTLQSRRRTTTDKRQRRQQQQQQETTTTTAAASDDYNSEDMME